MQPATVLVNHLTLSPSLSETLRVVNSSEKVSLYPAGTFADFGDITLPERLAGTELPDPLELLDPEVEEEPVAPAGEFPAADELVALFCMELV
jgi:hypothetical protein